DIDRLRQADLLNVLDEEALRLIAFTGDRRSVYDGATLFFEGEEADGALFVLTGRVSLQALVKDELSERSQVGEGTIIDPYALISQTRRGTTAKAVGDVSYLVLDRATFRRVLEEFPDVAERLQAYLADHIEHTVTSLKGVAARLDVLE
ncbi:MAG: Crp/Fnr family transcriptional regulator, partial [Pseudomonadota bacterium]